MKKFLAFSQDHYYASGGWKDFVGDFDTPEEAVSAASLCSKRTHGHWHVVDTELKQIVIVGSDEEIDDTKELE